MTLAGAESVLQSIYKLYPGTIYTLFHDPEGVKGAPFADAPFTCPCSSACLSAKSTTVPSCLCIHRNRAVRSASPSGYLVLLRRCQRRAYVVRSASHLLLPLSHAVRMGPHVPVFGSLGAYAWSQSFIARAIFHYIRLWDASSAIRVNEFVANSHYIADRIQKCYNRTATVIYPPVDVHKFSVGETKDSYFITMSRLCPTRYRSYYPGIQRASTSAFGGGRRPA